MREHETRGFLSRFLPSTIGSPQTSSGQELPENLAGEEMPVEWRRRGISASPATCRRPHGDCAKPGSRRPMEGQVSITSTDAFWNALSAYDTGSALATNEGSATGETAATSAADLSTSSSSAASAQAGALLSLLSGPSSAATPSSADTLLSQVLDGKSSSAAIAVTSAVNQSILDTLV